MILLTATTDIIEIVTSAAVTLDVHASYVDHASGTITPGRQNTAISTATTTTVVSSPGASTQRNVKTLNIRNRAASASVDVTVVFDQNTTNYELYKVSLRGGETLEYIEGVGFFVATGPSAPMRTFSTADQTISAADTYLTGSRIDIANVSRPIAVGTVFIWKIAMTKLVGSTGTATPIWNIRFGTAGSTGDTARCTFTGPAQTAATDAATVEIVAIVRGPIGAAAVVAGSLDLHHALAATGFANVAHHVGTATSAGFDITTVTAVGISVNNGASSTWTVTGVTGEVQNI